MRGITATLWAEILKIRKSKIFWLTVLFFMFVPLMLGLMMFVQKYPEISGKLGLIGTKAGLLRLGNGDWIAFLGLIGQTMAAIGMIGFGFVTSWVFGREYTDHTVKDILALPVSRTSIVLAKFIVVVIWCLLLSVIFYLFVLLIGVIISIPGWSGELAAQSAGRFALTSLLTLILCTPVAFFAGYSRGILVPLGFVILTLIMANFSGLVGLGPYFPWSIPGIYSIGSGSAEMKLNMASYIILFTTGIIGLFGTIAWWRWADQK